MLLLQNGGPQNSGTCAWWNAMYKKNGLEPR
jgi:hypothetical protein